MYRRIGWRLSAVSIVLSLVWPGLVSGQDADNTEEARERSIVARFVVVLEQNPRRGTAFDKVYGHHVERGSLESLIQSYRDRAAKSNLPADPARREAASAWIVVGLLESQRGRDAEAVKAFGEAERLAPDNPLASYYLGQSLILVGRPEPAVAAFERAIERKPAPSDLLEVCQTLGRTHQRLNQSEQARGVWDRLERLFPNDARVREQIATTLLEEGDYAAAQTRFSELARTTKDRSRKVAFQMEAADLLVRLGKGVEARRDLERLLDQLNPDHWLFREVRRRIEATYLRTDDQTGLARYYEERLKGNPADLDAVARLSRQLAGLGRTEEARGWLERTLKSAPSNRELRLELIQLLLAGHSLTEAIAQYELLDRHEPNHPDTLREWGRVILKDTTRDPVVRRRAAAAVWRRLLTSKPNDATVTIQVADLLRQSEMNDDALELYRRAVDLAPESGQYREYLGEFLHSLGKPAEALAVWRAMADGTRKTPANVARLAEVLATFEHLELAIETSAEACRLDPKLFAQQLKHADLLSRAERHEDALRQLDVVRRLAENDEEREACLRRELATLQAAGGLNERIAVVRKEAADPTTVPVATDAGKRERAERWYWLARACEVEQRLAEAADAVARGSELAPQSLPMLTASARIHEARNHLLVATDLFAKLASLDRRHRSEHLQQVVRLELKLGRRKQALQAGRDLLASAPGNPELYQIFARVCFQLGETKEGLETLRRVVRLAPQDLKSLAQLSQALAEQHQFQEAIELTWRAFERASRLDEQLELTARLTNLYSQLGQTDRLFERLERLRREPGQRHPMTMCLASVCEALGDLDTARLELESLLTEETKDLPLLRRLVQLQTTAGDLEAALKYQRQICRLTPDPDERTALFGLLRNTGQWDELNELQIELATLAGSPRQPVTLEEKLAAWDAILPEVRQHYQREILRSLLGSGDSPGEVPVAAATDANWELLYREGVWLAGSDRAAESIQRFEKLLAQRLPDDTATVAKPPVVPNRFGWPTPTPPPTGQAFTTRLQYVHEIRLSVGLDSPPEPDRRFQFLPQAPNQAWVPADFGQARLAALTWLFGFATRDGRADDFLADHYERAEAADDFRSWLDWYYLAALRRDTREQYQSLKRLAARDDADPEIQAAYLASLPLRGPADRVRIANPETGELLALRTPLQPDELELVVRLYRTAGAARDRFTFNPASLGQVTLELIGAERGVEARQLVREAVASATDRADMLALLPLLSARGESGTVIELLDRAARLPAEPSVNPNAAWSWRSHVLRPHYQTEHLTSLMSRRAAVGRLDDTLALWRATVSSSLARGVERRVAHAAGSPRSHHLGHSASAQVWRQGQQVHERLDFPLTSLTLDSDDIRLLRQLFVLYRDANRETELVRLFREAVEERTLSAEHRSFRLLGLGSLLWWTDAKDEALATMAEVMTLLPGDDSMRWGFVRLHESRQEWDRALKWLDGVQPANQEELRNREWRALHLSKSAGHTERMKTAAETLFGMRLQSYEQLMLAESMRELKLSASSTAMLARLDRRGTSSPHMLIRLMNEYVAQQQPELAVESALNASRQLDRAQRSGQSSQAYGRFQVAPRDEEIQTMRDQIQTVLRESGLLPEMIARIETQLMQAPNSPKLIETLIEYHTAAGATEQVAPLRVRLLEIKAVKPAARRALIDHLLSTGKIDAALEQIDRLLEQAPHEIASHCDGWLRTFEEHHRHEDLLDRLLLVDPTRCRDNVWSLARMINAVLSLEIQRPRTIRLFQKVWRDVPEHRLNLLSQLDRNRFWSLPGIAADVRQGLIPLAEHVASDPWFGLGHDGWNWLPQPADRTTGQRVLDLVEREGQLDGLAQELALATERLPDWKGGPAMRALVDLRRSRFAAAGEVLERLLPTLATAPERPHQAIREIAEGLAAHEATHALAIRYLELLVGPTQLQNDYGPNSMLARLYARTDRRAEARQLLMRLEPTATRTPHHSPSDDLVLFLGREFRQAGFPLDAVRLYWRQLTHDHADGFGSRHFIDQSKPKVKSALKETLGQVTPDALIDLLAVAAVTRGDDDRPLIDLMLTVEPVGLDSIRMTSLLQRLAVKVASGPETLRRAREVLHRLRTEPVKDLNTLALAALIALHANDGDEADHWLRELVGFTTNHPLEAPRSKLGLTARQRAAANRQIVLWLVARECLTRESLRVHGEALGERALLCARRQNESRFTHAILREWGQLASDAGDKETANRRWGEMLDEVLRRP